MTHSHKHRHTLALTVAGIALGVILFGVTAQVVEAVATGNPMTLVNTESKYIIDSGDGTTNIQLFFGESGNRQIFYDITNSRFHFTQAVIIGGNLTATGSINASGSILTNTNITINSDNGAADAQITFGNASGQQTFKYLNTPQKFQLSKPLSVIGNVSGSTLNVDGNAAIYGVVKASGALKTQSGITINFNNAASNAVLNFGNATANQTLKYIHSSQRFEFSKDLKVNGSISGSTLTIDGNVSLKGTTYSFPDAQGAANTYLKNAGNGTLSWSTVTLGNSSGHIVSMHPEYPNAVYFSSGSAAVGTLTYSYDTTNRENYYRWASTRGTIQDYWTAVRLQVPRNFVHFETASGMVLRLRTTSTTVGVNHATIRLLDTAGSAVALSGNASLTSTAANTWDNKQITNLIGGTYTPGGFITLLIKTATTSAGSVDLGSLTINWTTTTP